MHTCAYPLIRWTTILLVLVQTLYWHFAESQTDRAKPKHHPPSREATTQRLVLQLFVLIMALQLLGVLSIAPFPPNLAVELAGLILGALGLLVCIAARRSLGDNWSHGAEFRIKARQELITSGVYRYIRHPIYAGLALGIIGVELVAHSYLAFVLAPVLALTIYAQSRREEALLVKHFGRPYLDYLDHTAMFIPGLW